MEAVPLTLNANANANADDTPRCTPCSAIASHRDMVALSLFGGENLSRPPPMDPDQHAKPTSTTAITTNRCLMVTNMDSHTSKIKPWDGMPITASLFLRDIGEHAAEHGYLTLLLQNWVTSKNTIIVLNPDIIPRIRAAYQNPEQQILHEDIQNPPTPPMTAARDGNYSMTAEDKRQFCNSPELFFAMSGQRAAAIIGSIQNTTIARRVRANARGDARAVLCEIVAIRNQLTSAHITTHLRRIAAYARQGITGMTIAAWSKFREEYDDMTFCLPGTHALPDAYVAQDYRRAIAPLGPQFNMLVSTEIKLRQADSLSTETAAAIASIIDEQSLLAAAEPPQRSTLMSANREQAATPRGDPRKLPRPTSKWMGAKKHASTSKFSSGNNRPKFSDLKWDESRRPCINFGSDPRCDGKHLDRDCPIKNTKRTMTSCNAGIDNNEDSLLELLNSDASPLDEIFSENPTNRTLMVANFNENIGKDNSGCAQELPHLVGSCQHVQPSINKDPATRKPLNTLDMDNSARASNTYLTKISASPVSSDDSSVAIDNEGILSKLRVNQDWPTPFSLEPSTFCQNATNTIDTATRPSEAHALERGEHRACCTRSVKHDSRKYLPGTNDSSSDNETNGTSSPERVTPKPLPDINQVFTLATAPKACLQSAYGFGQNENFAIGSSTAEPTHGSFDDVLNDIFTSPPKLSRPPTPCIQAVDHLHAQPSGTDKTYTAGGNGAHIGDITASWLRSIRSADEELERQQCNLALHRRNLQAQKRHLESFQPDKDSIHSPPAPSFANACCAYLSRAKRTRHSDDWMLADEVLDEAVSTTSPSYSSTLAPNVITRDHVAGCCAANPDSWDTLKNATESDFISELFNENAFKQKQVDAAVFQVLAERVADGQDKINAAGIIATSATADFSPSSTPRSDTEMITEQRCCNARNTKTDGILIKCLSTYPTAFHWVVLKGHHTGIHYNSATDMRNMLHPAHRTVYCCTDLRSALCIAIRELNMVKIHSTSMHEKQAAIFTANSSANTTSILSDAFVPIKFGTPLPRPSKGTPTAVSNQRPPCRRPTNYNTRKTLFPARPNLITEILKAMAMVIPGLAFAARTTYLQISKRALCSMNTEKRKSKNNPGVTNIITDSGATTHSHHSLEDLKNVRKCNEKLTTANGESESCEYIGDLPIAVVTKSGKILHVLVSNVRYMPGYIDTLFSQHQLWQEQGIDVKYANENKMQFKDGEEIELQWRNGVYSIRAIIDPPRQLALAEIAGARSYSARNARAQSSNQKLPPNAAAQLMHQRLHLSLAKLKQLAYHTADAPRSLALATHISCEACDQANARALAHPPKGYVPSRVGSVIYFDDAGPHQQAALGGVKYFRIFVDSHTRFRLTYFMRARVEGVEVTRRFLAEFAALAGAENGTQIVQRINSDNAPEIMSNEFANLMLENKIVHTTSPAHIKQANGVAERAIGTSRAVARSIMIAANAPMWTWGCAIMQAEDILNHCSGPSANYNCNADGISSYQLLTGKLPNVMSILPFGCLAIATKPKIPGKKIMFGARGHRAINLGRSRETPGAYRLWIPSERKLVVTSDVLFHEDRFPWKPTEPITHAVPCKTPRNTSTTVLNLFSGAYKRDNGLSAALRDRGYKVMDVDNSATNGGGHEHDINNDQFFASLLNMAKNGHFRAVFTAPPCSTFSVSRFFDFKGKDGHDKGPPIVRDRDNICGLPDVPPAHLKELRTANAIVARSIAITNEVANSGGSFCIENPADRGDKTNLITYDPNLKQHGPLWLMPEILELAKTHNAQSVTFALCMFGSPFQKYTTLLFSPDLNPGLSPLAKQCCSHTPEQHEALVGKADDGHWKSAHAAAYPVKFAQALANALPHITAINNSNEDAEELHTETEPETPPNGPRPGGGTFEMRQRNFPEKIQQKTEQGPRPDGGTFNMRNRQTPSVCAVLPNSTPGRTLQVLRTAPDTASPRGRKTALQQNKEHWLAAEKRELESHERNKSWTVIPITEVPPGRRIIKMLWVYKIKRDGTHKARLCVMGSSQRPGVDFDQTYCATMRAASLRILAAVSAKLGLSIWRIDFVSAYLQGRLEDGEVVFCHMAEGYETTGHDGRPNVVRVEKPIYGLAQSGRRWQRSLFPWLKRNGFIQSNYDPCVFIKREKNNGRDEVIFIGCYVDDLLICASHTEPSSIFRAFVNALKKDWEIDDEGEAVDLLNVHFAKTDSGILLHQRPYIESMIEKYVPEGVPLSFHRNWTPCNAELPELVRVAMENKADPERGLLKSYQQLVGSLLYCATHTRPDIAYAMGMLCRAMSRPTSTLYKAALRVLYYLSRHADIGLYYESDPSAICAYSDSDLGTQKSTTGWDIRWQKATISFGSKKQPTIATSSCHAELIAASEAAKETKFYREFTNELGFPNNEATTLYVDNTATVNLAYNPEYHSRTKHIDRRHFYVRELVEEHIINVKYVNSADNLADFFTKPLPPKTFFKLRDKIMNIQDAHVAA